MKKYVVRNRVTGGVMAAFTSRECAKQWAELPEHQGKHLAIDEQEEEVAKTIKVKGMHISVEYNVRLEEVELPEYLHTELFGISLLSDGVDAHEVSDELLDWLAYNTHKENSYNSRYRVEM